jgi:glutathione S-transferase
MKLYYMPGACSLSPHIVALEAGLPLTLSRVSMADGKKTADGKDFAAINPKGYVPALELDSGDVLTEGPAIVQYLADQKPGAGLLPASGMARYRVTEWLAFINSELHKTFGTMFTPGASDAEKQNAVGTLQKRFKYVDEKLAGQQHLTGDAFTVADAYLFVVLGWAGFVKLDISPYSNIGAFLGRVGSRPKVQEAMKAEGLIK